jgi:NADH-quinone oxidoreductase subunit M
MVLGVIIALIVFLGVYPKPLVERVEPSVDALIEHLEARTGETVPEPEPELVEEEGG